MLSEPFGSSHSIPPQKNLPLGEVFHLVALMILNPIIRYPCCQTIKLKVYLISRCYNLAVLHLCYLLNKPVVLSLITDYFACKHVRNIFPVFARIIMLPVSDCLIELISIIGGFFHRIINYLSPTVQQIISS